MVADVKAVEQLLLSSRAAEVQQIQMQHLLQTVLHMDARECCNRMQVVPSPELTKPPPLNFLYVTFLHTHAISPW